MDSTSEANAELRTRLRQQEVVADLGQQALETDDLDGLMHDASAGVAETLDNEYAKVLELLPGGEEVFLRQGVGWREGLVGSATVPTDLDSQAGYTLLSEQPIIVDDLRTEERFSGPELLTSHDVVSGISVVIGSVEEPWGVLGTHTTESREFTEHDANFVQSVANVLATAIENAQTRRELEESYGRITDAFYALDEDWTFTDVDDRAKALIDPDGDGLVGETVWDEFEWAADSKLKEEYERAMETQEPTTFELYYPDPIDGWFEIHAAPSETTLSVYFRDISGRKEREQQLEQYHALTEAASDVIVTIDAQSTIQSVNPAVEDVFGYRPDELAGESLTTLMPDALADRHRTGLERYLETGDRTLDWDYVELQGRHADGSEIPLAVSFSEADYEGERYFTGIVRDVTEREERERDLELFRSLLNQSNDSVLVIDPETGQYLDVNETACQRRGYSRAEFLQLTVPDLQTELPDHDAWQSFVADLEDEGRTTFEGAHRRKDGTTYPIEVNAAYVELDQAYVLSIARDVTERRERERQLEESERRYRTLAECFPNGIVTLFDEDLEYTLAAGRAFDDLPLDPDDLEGRSVRDAWDERIADTLEPKLRSVLDDAEASVELEYAGREWIVHVVPITDEDETVSTGIAMAQDITERKEYQRQLEDVIEQLEESNERLEQFAYAASHDLQEPLRMVTSYLQLLENRYGDAFDEDGEEFLAFAVDGAERMREMIEGLLEYSRVDTQGAPLEPLELNNVLEATLENLQVKIEESDAEITAESLPRVHGDERQLQQVFQNLLSNAIEYSGDEPPRIHVAAEQDGWKWVISVRDEGIGIDPDDEDRVFDVFQRLHSHDEHSGTGIGLALSQRIVERHGGEIWVDSEPGEGATFSFTLPSENTDNK